MNTHLTSEIRGRRKPRRPALWTAPLLGLALATAGGALHAAGERATIVDPPDLGDRSGDLRAVGAQVLGDHLYLSLTVQGVVAPTTAQTPDGKVNRYYYHWLLDTDNNPATGRSNAEYEGNPTGVTNPIGAERVIMVGWRDGKPNGIEIYDALDDDNVLVTDFTYQASGNTLTAVIPLSNLGLTLGQTIAVAAFQEGASDDWAVDWTESDTLTLGGLDPAMVRVTDPADLGDSSGDLRALGAHVLGDQLHLTLSVQGVVAPSTAQTPEGKVNRYYYHWLLDTDNNPATGRSNAEYEGNPTGVQQPIGAERVVMVGWRDGKPNGVEVYDALDDDNVLLSGFTFVTGGNTLHAIIPLAELGLSPGQTVAVSAFQEGASDDWAVDWMESAQLTLTGPAVSQAQVADASDLGDSSGDIRAITAQVEGESLRLSMTVEGVAAPSVEQTPEGKVNRYYYHWLLDTDNNPATGRSNAEYEGNPTGVQQPIGAERVVMIGWRDGQPNGIEVYDALDDDNVLVADFQYQAAGNTLVASIPLASLGLSLGQTIAVSGFQEGASDDWAVDWIESATITLEPPAGGRMKIDGQFQDWTEAAGAGLVAGVDDPQDLGDSSGDLKRVEATVEGGYLYLRLTVHGVALPSAEQTPEGKVNRYYYHWLLDTDNNPATGRSNAEYEGNPTGVQTPIGAERVIQVGWRNGAPDGVYAYDPSDEETALVEDFEVAGAGDSFEARIRLADLGLSPGQTIALSAFQEGASDGWAVDWVESVVLTLTEGGGGNMTLETLFSGNPYGFEIQVEDDGADQVDPASVVVRSGGQAVAPAVNKTGGLTTIVGRHPALLEVGSLQTVSLSLTAGGETQSKDFVFRVEPYTVLPTAGSLGNLDQGNAGWLINATMISSAQSTVTSLHSNVAELAEVQLTGRLTNELTGTLYINEAGDDWTRWVVNPLVETGVINWFELAPGTDASLNFPNDDGIPILSNMGVIIEGVVIELLTYLELSEGYHKLGLYTEGGHKVTAGFAPFSPLLSQFDNSGDVERVPTYHARSQFFDVVAPQAGYYPLRVLWFQSKRNQEPGLMLELFSVQDRALHLLNQADNPKSLRAYRAEALLDPNGVIPTLLVQRQGANVVLHWTGVLQVADQVNGPWTDQADDSQSPLTLPVDRPFRFARSRTP